VLAEVESRFEVAPVALERESSRKDEFFTN